MARQHDQQCTPMKENWAAFWRSWLTFNPFKIGHEGKNVWVESRRWKKGECENKSKKVVDCTAQLDELAAYSAKDKVPPND